MDSGSECVPQLLPLVPLCASISVSHKHDDCRWMRWFSTEVDIKHLHIPEARWLTTALTQDGQGYRSGPLVARNSSVQPPR